MESKGSTIEGDAGSEFSESDAAEINSDGNILNQKAVTGEASYEGIFQFAESDWIQVGKDILEFSDAPQFGRSVCINLVGIFVSIGTRFNSGAN